VTAAAGRDVGEDLAAKAADEFAEGLCLSSHLGRRVSTMFMAVLSGTFEVTD